MGGFTNLSRDHLDFHPTMADYFEAKALLFDPELPAARPHASWSASTTTPDARWPPGRRRDHRQRRRPAGTTGAPQDVSPVDAGGQEFTVVDPAGVHAPGRHPAAGSLQRRQLPCRAGILDAVGVSPEQAAPGLRRPAVPGRLEQIDRGQDFLALVDYAHKPGALQAVLTTLRAPGRRLAVVFGAGGDRDPGKRAPMGEVAAELADLVVVTDDNPRSEDPAAIRREILAGAAEAGVRQRRSSRSATGARPSGTRSAGRGRVTWC